PRGVETHHDADARQADVREELLEALAPVDGGARAPQVVVNDPDALARPAEGDGPRDELVLPVGALSVARHLPGGRLADVDVGPARPVLRADDGAGLARCATHD